jgi:hypothetical protein
MRLQAIKFAHGPLARGAGALRLRRNASTPVEVPEWREGASAQHYESVAAYAISRARGRTITIQANLVREGDDPQTAEICAVPRLIPPPPPWWLYPGGAASPAAAAELAAWHVRLLSAIAAGAAGDALGSVAARTVTFRPDRTTGFQTFELHDPRLASRGVGVYDVTWRWQYRRTSGDPWRDFAETRHRAYAVLDTPKAPWVQDGNAANTQLPWTDVLEYACRWASGARRADDAAALVTLAVNSLGNGVIEYGCPILAISQYSMPFFSCTAFLERLRGSVGNGPYVNCSDCATIVSTFANALGCDLWQSKMAGEFPFALNPILAIGSRVWQIACGWGSFNYHEVAWKDGCRENDEVFDACLHVDGDLNPGSAPHRPLLPLNLVFGFPGQGLYRDLLASPLGTIHCRPQPTTRQRRIVV